MSTIFHLCHWKCCWKQWLSIIIAAVLLVLLWGEMSLFANLDKPLWINLLTTFVVACLLTLVISCQNQITMERPDDIVGSVILGAVIAIIGGLIITALIVNLNFLIGVIAGIVISAAFAGFSSHSVSGFNTFDFSSCSLGEIMGLAITTAVYYGLWQLILRIF